MRLCYAFKGVISFGGGSLPLQICDDCDPAGYSAVRSVKLRSLTFKGVVNQHTEAGSAGSNSKPTDRIDHNDEDTDSFDDMTSSESEPEEMEDSVGGDNIYHPRQDYEGGSMGDDYNSVDSYSTAGESGTYASSSYYSQNSHVQSEKWKEPRAGDDSVVNGWIAIVHAKMAATKIARRMKRKLAVDMAKKANDHDLAKALPEAVDGCVSPHMNMISLLSYGGGGKGGSGYHLQVFTLRFVWNNFLLT